MLFSRRRASKRLRKTYLVNLYVNRCEVQYLVVQGNFSAWTSEEPALLSRSPHFLEVCKKAGVPLDPSSSRLRPASSGQLWC